MNICIPRERRPFEYRVGLSPAGVEMLTMRGHTCYVEHDAGRGAGFRDEDYERAGARIVYTPEEAFGRGDLVLKVARPVDNELNWLRPNAIVMGLLHLPSAREDKIRQMLDNNITAISYEQIVSADGGRPVLRPFSQIGGAMTAQIAARLLQSDMGGKGILLGGVPGVPPAEVVIIGGGVVGTYAAQAFLGLGAHVTLLDASMEVLQRVAERFRGQVVTMISTRRNIERVIRFADVVVTAVLVPGQRAPILIRREMLAGMKPRSLIMDVSIDEGGCVETSRPTTHERPVFMEENVMHYCVPNMPGVVARTATHAFVNAAMPFILEIVEKGIARAMRDNPAIEHAVNTYQGKLRHIARLGL